MAALAEIYKLNLVLILNNNIKLHLLFAIASALSMLPTIIIVIPFFRNSKFRTLPDLLLTRTVGVCNSSPVWL